MISPDDRENIDAGCCGRSEDFYDLAFWIYVARFPSLQTDHNFVANCRGRLRLTIPFGTHVHVVHKSRIVRDDVVKIARMLERPDDGIVFALQNSNHASFAPSLRTSVGRIPRNASNYAVAVHGCSRVLRRDKSVRLARFFADEKSVSGLMNAERASDQIDYGRQNIAIFPDPRDLARALELTQRLV